MSVSKRALTWTAAVGVVLIAGYWLAKPAPQARPPATIQSSTAAAPAAGESFVVHVAAAGEPQEQSVFRVTQDDEVAIRVISKQTGTLMLHGVTDNLALEENGETTLRFKATHTGRFPLHLHGKDNSHTELAAVEIMPK